ncbi:helix-turn-helix domain-containing protein [Arthrobacter psychrolactophilus]|uniref:helix-turn-helix domain-containing protein n=1 Tax=Arthrobacter psychrolactophilus TaxID=92442 RepID=UPI0015E891EC|nr:helix-turn-helix domain-containing protein [Arthrobacter psychrolactophilus]
MRGIDFGETSVFKFSLTPGISKVVSQADGNDSLILVFILTGTMRLLEDETEPGLTAHPGQSWMYNRATEFQMEVLEEATFTAITLPVQVLRDFGIKEFPSLHALASIPSLAPAALGFVKQALEHELPISSVAGYFMEKLLHEMVGGIMLEDLGAKVTGTGRKSTFDQAMAYIGATAGDRDLTPARLAEELSVSLRQLQREFKRNNLTIAEVMRNHRIDLAVKLLKDPKLEVLSLEKIAEHAGFSSLVQMRRTLHEAQLGKPREIRSGYVAPSDVVDPAV